MGKMKRGREKETLISKVNMIFAYQVLWQCRKKCAVGLQMQKVELDSHL